MMLLKIDFSPASLFGTVMTLYLLVFALGIGVFLLYYRYAEQVESDRREREILVAHINQLTAELAEIRDRMEEK